jgi:hypothetical protein
MRMELVYRKILDIVKILVNLFKEILIKKVLLTQVKLILKVEFMIMFLFK